MRRFAVNELKLSANSHGHNALGVWLPGSAACGRSLLVIEKRANIKIPSHQIFNA
jgi:hypothetical protein